MAAGDEGDGDAYTEDECGDAIHEGYRGEMGLWDNVGQREDDVVHDDVNRYTVEGAVEQGTAGEREPAAGKKVDSCRSEGDEEVEDEAEQGGAAALSEGGTTEKAAGDTLKNSNGRDAMETIEDEGVGDVEDANE